MNEINVKELREKLKLTTQQLADKIGVSRYTINRWETGKTKPHSVFVKALNELEAKHDNGSNQQERSTKRRKT
jgi:DNA-binding XRE family transcriptional regulator